MLAYSRPGAGVGWTPIPKPSTRHGFTATQLAALDRGEAIDTGTYLGSPTLYRRTAPASTQLALTLDAS